nr:venom protein [Lampona murina]
MTDCCFEGKGFKATFTIIDEDEVITTSPPDPFIETCTCGIENIQDGERILGGKTVSPPHRYPWVVALAKERSNNQFFCGGALINKQYALTAAHCLEKENIFDLRLAVGAHNSEAHPATVRASRFIIHPNFKNKIYTNDIALIKLDVPLMFNDTVSPLCLPAERDIVSEGTIAVVAGWGTEIFGSSESVNNLQEVHVPIVSNAKCAAKFYRGFILDTNVCAGGELGRDACVGDSGGALFSKQDGRWHAVGIVSFGSTCGQEHYPGVYTRVSKYLQWIKDETNDAPPCDEVIKPPPVQPNLDNCGVANTDLNERIVGGKEATPFEFPWMAMIVYDGTVIGAGALISPFYVITAASTFDNIRQWYPGLLSVFLGRHSLSGGVDSASKGFTVESIHFHPRYGIPSPYNNDLSLLRLNASEGGVSDIYKPICLPRSDAWYPHGLSLTTAGWGSLSNSGDGSNVLMKVDLNSWDEEQCEQRYPGWFTETMLCAYKQGADTCDDDYGAPLMRLYSERYYLAGVSSWASKNECAVRNAPRVFAAIHANLRWISNMTGLDVK